MGIEDLRNRDWLLLPGTLCTVEVFTGFLDALEIPETRRSLLALRHPAVEDYAETLEKRTPGAVLCGFSLGAIVAAHLADRCDATRIILFGLNPFADDPAKAPGRRNLARDVAARGGAGALMPGLPPLGGPSPETARAAILAMADAAARDIEAQTELALSRPGALDALSRARAPVFALTGSEDQMAPLAQGQAAADAAPRGMFKHIPGLGHYALLEDPMACARAVLELETALSSPVTDDTPPARSG